MIQQMIVFQIIFIIAHNIYPLYPLITNCAK